jgi:NitT/TauT family transport system substrate-binding protein
MQNRRHFLTTGFSLAAAGLAGAAALTRAPRSRAEEAPPETTSVRLLYYKDDATCIAPIDILDDLLRDEGFADVRYVPGTEGDVTAVRVARGDVDFTHDFAATNTISIDAGVATVMLAGVHPACFELFARESIRSVVDLKGKTVGVVVDRTGVDYVMLNVITASVGLDPAKDINWVAFGQGDPKGLLADRRSMRS